MNEIDILTERNYQHWLSWDVVYEWEDIIANELSINIVDMYHGWMGQCIRFFKKILWKILRFTGLQFGKFKVSKRGKWHIVWIMNASIYEEYMIKNAIPIFLDFPVCMVKKIYHATKKLPVYWVTCYDVYLKLVEAGSNNVRYMPLSVSDIHVEKKISEKTIDVIQVGRKNEIIHKFMMDFCKKYPNVEYVYVYNDKQEYISTKRGKIGIISNRKKYISLLKNAKVCLVSTPGSTSTNRFGNIDFFTPRFYESAACYCFMIGKYTTNEESKIIGIHKVCKNVDNTLEFEKIMIEVLSKNSNILLDEYKDFLNNNTTSQRAKEIKKVLIEKEIL